MIFGKKVQELTVGQLLVRGRSIIEPMTNCYIARAFPTELHALSAAKELDALTDWFGVIKIRATGGNANCRLEMERIVREYGGRFATNATDDTETRCRKVVELRDSGPVDR